MIDTHCHLNFGAFEGKIGEVIEAAGRVGVSHFIVPGTDAATSRKAVEVAATTPGAYAAVGIHPHHVFENDADSVAAAISDIEDLLRTHPTIVAVGEVGLDRHYYEMTKYKEYKVDESFMGRQTDALRRQIRLALTYGKSLILHNREAKREFLDLVRDVWDSRLAGRTVFHCCEPNEEFISFACDKSIYIGVDGDVTFDGAKQDFIKRVPLEMLVVETDAPFLTPEPVRSSAKKRPKNEPANLPLILQRVAELKAVSVAEADALTTRNARSLFRLPEEK